MAKATGFVEGDAVLWGVGPYMANQVVSPRSRYTYNNQTRLPATDVVMQLTTEGQLQYRRAAGNLQTIMPGHLLLFALNEPTTYFLPEPRDFVYRCTWCHLSGAGLRTHIQAYRKRHGSIVDLRPPSLRQLFDQLVDWADPAGKPHVFEVSMSVHRFVMTLFEYAERDRSAVQTPAQRAIEMLIRQPHRPWSLKQVADEYGCTREHLTRIFKQTTGESPGAYLARARLTRAMDLLTQTQLPIHAVAEQAGYGTVHSLARHIRAHTGASPGSVAKRIASP